MLVSVKNSGPHLERQRLDALLLQWGISFPEGFRDFLLENNGGVPTPSGFTIPDAPHMSQHVIQEFFGIDRPRPESNIEWNLGLSEVFAHLGLCPIARTPTGELLCLGVSKENWNSVWLYDFHYPTRGIYSVQRSFESLLDDLHYSQEEGEEYFQHVARNYSTGEVAKLIASGANVNTPDSYDRTLIEWAVICNRLDLVKFLVARGLPLRKAMTYAEENYEFFPEFRELREWLRSLKS
jgi:hypothetical protein